MNPEKLEHVLDFILNPDSVHKKSAAILLRSRIQRENDAHKYQNEENLEVGSGEDILEDLDVIGIEPVIEVNVDAPNSNETNSIWVNDCHDYVEKILKHLETGDASANDLKCIFKSIGTLMKSLISLDSKTVSSTYKSLDPLTRLDGIEQATTIDSFDLQHDWKRTNS
ncbi:unnamed protein product [Mytilus coruscus]|uniref:Uncharacterized protein n=1 Tax=Mytilus coruscus TaxID=42192 RepID=A0A6J8A5X1_MYTCO|nr:unnamed protein product [Mytilus coruscus]